MVKKNRRAGVISPATSTATTPSPGPRTRSGRAGLKSKGSKKLASAKKRTSITPQVEELQVPVGDSNASTQIGNGPGIAPTDAEVKVTSHSGANGLETANRPKFDFDQGDDDQSGDDDGDNSGAGHDSMLKTLMKNSKYGGSLSEFGARRWASKRTEAGKNISEHGISKDKRSKVALTKLMKVSKNVEAKKSLRNFHERPLLDAPLKLQHAKKAARRVNFEEVKTEISKYEPIVKEIRQADQLVFPRDQQKVTFNVAAQFATSGSEAPEPRSTRTLKGLEKEITEQLMLSEENVEFDNRPLTENELNVLKSRNIEEARMMHREIQRRRMLISYQEAKFRRMRRIKSKKFHRIQKKERLKKTVDELDQLMAEGSDQAMAKLEELDKLRALERASLKHHITGKWAKYNKLRAKYDDSAREELNNQMAINAELMKKRSLALLDTLDDAQGGGDDDGGEIDYGRVNTGGGQWEEIAIPENYNPWISSTKIKDNSKKVKIVPEAKSAKPKDDNSLERFFAKRVQKRIEQNDADEKAELVRLDELDEKNLDEGVGFVPSEDQNGHKVPRQKKVNATRLTTTIVPASDDEQSDQEADTDEEQSNSVQNVNLNLDNVLGVTKNGKKKRKRASMNGGGEENNESGEEDDEDELHEMGEFDFRGSDMQKYLAEAFIDDDVVEDFLKEKRAKIKEEEGERKPDLYLPGWGAWAGSGIKETKRKKAKQVRKEVNAQKRLDTQITNAIILKDVDQIGSKFKIAFKPASVPNLKEFEQKCAKPIGASWNPETVFKSMTEPKVITPIGTIIAPMESTVVKDSAIKGGNLKPKSKSQRRPLR